MRNRDYYLMQRMGRDYYRDRHMMRQPRKQANKGQENRLVNPKQFSDVFDNPLLNLMPIVEYLSGVKVEKDADKKSEIDDRRHEGFEMFDIHERYGRRGHREYRDYRDRYNYGDEEYYQQEAQNQDKKYDLTTVIKKQNNHTFDSIKNDVLRQLTSNKERMSKNRKNNVEFIQNTLGVSLQNYDLLNKSKLDDNWQTIQVIIHKKLSSIQQIFAKKIVLFEKIFSFEGKIQSTLNTNKQIKLLKHLNSQQQSTIFSLLLLYIALPNLETFHLQISTFQKKSREIFQQLSEDEDEMRRVLKYLPYKESSFYWNKIIQCCRYISECDHYKDLDTRKVQNFEAEYAGTITHDILKKLKENQWLDNSITSAVIQYLKQVEGANNYHNDNNFRVCVFTHSETQIFVNSQRDNDNYLSYQKLIFLVNYDNIHWFVITVYNSTFDIVVYDSLGTYPQVYKQYCEKIAKKLKRRKPDAEYKFTQYYTPKQSNVSDCGLFSIVNMICAFDKPPNAQKSNKFSPSIISEIRHSLMLFLLYLGYCKRLQVVPRKDYFDILFRSTIFYEMTSLLHKQKRSK